MQSIREIKTPVNSFKAGLETGKIQFGIWAQLGSPITTQITAGAGFDFLVIDGEHAPSNDVSMIIPQITAVYASNYLTGYETSPIVRTPWNDPVVFKRLLDGGAQTLLVPMVNTAKEAEAAAAAVRYRRLSESLNPTRGVALAHPSNLFGRCSDYLDEADEQIFLIAQIETLVAINNLKDIATVCGVDALFVGPSDLAADLGYIGNPAHEKVQEQISNACARANEAKIPIGILTGDPKLAKSYESMGFSFVAVGSDLALLRLGVDGLRKRF